MSRHSYSGLQRQSIAKDRVIAELPKAFRASVTPYKSINFNPRVREATSHILGMKVAKAVVVGEVAVGKTCLVQRFVTETFDRDYKATIGVDFEVEKFSVLSIPFTLQLWDTAGQERFKSIAASYYRSAHAVIVVFDFSSFDSLQQAKQWKEVACSNVQTDDPIVFLVGSKKDLVSESVYQSIENEATAMAKEIGAEYWAVSSKTGENVKALFFRITALMFDAAVLRELKPPDSSKKIGNDLIKVQKEPQQSDVWSRTKNKVKCCQ